MGTVQGSNATGVFPKSAISKYRKPIVPENVFADSPSLEAGRKSTSSVRSVVFLSTRRESLANFSTLPRSMDQVDKANWRRSAIELGIREYR